MKLVHLSSIYDEIIEERLELNQLTDEAIKLEKLKNARKEEKKKLRRAYDLFDIDINRLSVKDRYYINEEYKESIIWILLYTGTYKSTNKEIEAERDVPTQIMETFMNGKFQYIGTVFLKYIIDHMVNGLLAFNTDKLSDNQREYLEKGIQCIYSSTRLYHRQVDEMMGNLFDDTMFRLEDKRIIYRYLKEILSNIGDIAKQLVYKINEYREAEQLDHVFDQINEVNQYEERQKSKEEEKILKEIVYDSSIVVLKEILYNMDQEKAELNEENINLNIRSDIKEWLEGTSKDLGVREKMKSSSCREKVKLEQMLQGLEAEVIFLEKEKKRIHYTSKGKKDIQAQIEQYKLIKENIASKIGELAHKDKHI